jgi:hypothetical protein
MDPRPGGPATREITRMQYCDGIEARLSVHVADTLQEQMQMPRLNQ